MAKQLPSLGELEIRVLRLVWEHQPCTERQISERVMPEQGVARTTVLKTMQRLEAKGLLARVPGDGPVKFKAVLDRRRLLPALVSRFVETVLGGSADPLVAYLADDSRLSAKDLEALKAIARKIDPMNDAIRILNDASAIWAERTWAVFWQSTILVVAVALVAALALRRSSPALRYWVWQIVALKLLLMPFWTYAVPLPQFVSFQSVEPPTFSEPDVVPESITPRAEISLDSPAIAVPAQAEHVNEPPLAPIELRPTWQSWLLIGWCAVIAAQIGRLVRQRSRLNRLLAQATPADERLEAAVRDAAALLGLRTPPRALLTDVECSPFVCGVRRAVLVLPRDLVRSLDSVPLNHVLLHEMAHIRRYDLVWGWIGAIARLVYFFHPAVHWINYRARLERELACDQLAMSLTGWDPAAYAATLVRVVSRTSPSALLTATASSPLDGNSSSEPERSFLSQGAT